MKNKISLIFRFLFVVANLSSCQNRKSTTSAFIKVTPEMVAEQEALCIDKDQVYNSKIYYDNLDSISIAEIKDYFNQSLRSSQDAAKDYYSPEKDLDAYNEELKKEIRHYSANEESYLDTEPWNKDLVSNKHLLFRDIVENGVNLKQTFFKNKADIDLILTKNEFGENISDYLGYHSEFDFNPIKIYYHDSLAILKPLEFEGFSKGYNLKTKRVDSIETNVKVTYLSKVDTVHFTKADIGVQKGSFKLLKMLDNYVEIELPTDYYNNDKILAKKFFNQDNKLISIDKVEKLDFGKELYPKESLKLLEVQLNSIKNLNNREDIDLTLRYFYLRNANLNYNSKTIVKHFVKGNVSSCKLYLENTRDSLSFTTMIKSIEPVRNVHENKFLEKTDFIDNDGKLLSSIPHNINFIATKNKNITSAIYFSVYVNNSSEYYYLNQKNGAYTKLPYIELKFLTPNLMLARLSEKQGYILVSSIGNKTLADITIRDYWLNPNFSEGITIYDEDAAYKIYNQDKKLIKYNTSTPITKVILKKID